MMKKRYLVALGAVSAALTACGSDMIAPADKASGGASGSAGSSGSSGSATGGTSGSSMGGTSGSTTGGASGSTTGGTGGTGTGGASGGGGTGNDGGAPPACAPGVPAGSQIPRLLKRQYDAVVRDLLGITVLADGRAPSAGLYDDFDGPMNKDSWIFFQEVGAKVASAVMNGATKSKFITCDPAAPDCLKQTVEAFGRKAFRRPLTTAEVDRFLKLGQTTPAGTPAEVAETTLYAFLVSPSFLQITELTQEAEPTTPGAIKLSQYEVAARLSFLLWGSIPDETLSMAADAGQLTTKDQILAQATRMIGVREKTAPLVANFHRKYLEMDNADAHWWKVDHDKTKFPLYPGETAKDTYGHELDRFFEEVAFAGGSFKDIFLSNVAFVNKDTAPIYGLDGSAYGTELTRVELDPAQRPGFLTRLGFLSSYSHYESTSPILRGAFITVSIIGVNPGAPDPNFFLTAAPPGDYKTERSYVEALTGQPNCKGCHIPYINPPGFAMENYDSIGKWQTVDPRANGDAVAGAITIDSDVTFAEGNVKKITSPRQLMEELAQVPAAKRIYAEKWVSFATGRLPNAQDACAVDQLELKLASDGYTVLSLLGDLTQSDSFRLRVKGN